MTTIRDATRRPRSRALPRLVLAGTVVMLAACLSDPAPPFTVEGTGDLEGLVFFDADRNGVYDPAAGDFVVAGATVQAQERGSGQDFSGGQAVTGADGRFLIPSLPPGTHDVFIDTSTTPGGVFFCQNPTPATVDIDLVRFVALLGRDGCVIPIWDAEVLLTTPATFVTVRGIVTAQPGQLRSAGDNAYIEDATSGVLLFGGALNNLGITIGDRIEVSGEMVTFNDESEVAGALRVNEIIKGVLVPQPTSVETKRAADAGARLDSLQGRLVLLTRAEQTSAFASGGGRNATFDDNSGATEVRIESGLVPTSTDVATTFPHNPAAPKCYNITGVLGSFNGTAQVKPRTLADMQEVSCTP